MPTRKPSRNEGSSQASQSTSPGAVRIWLLGGFRVSIRSKTIEDGAWRLKRAAALVKLFALAPGHRMRREQAMELLWPGTGQVTGVQCRPRPPARTSSRSSGDCASQATTPSETTIPRSGSLSTRTGHRPFLVDGRCRGPSGTAEGVPPLGPGFADVRCFALAFAIGGLLEPLPVLMLALLAQPLELSAGRRRSSRTSWSADRLTRAGASFCLRPRLYRAKRYTRR
jgi:hypothetical protein